MPASLLMLLDDIASVLDDVGTMTKVAAAKTAGVVGDDLALNAKQIAGVQVRAGHHCAALVHDHLGTRDGGTVRASFGPFTAPDDVDALVAAVGTIVG